MRQNEWQHQNEIPSLFFSVALSPVATVTSFWIFLEAPLRVWFLGIHMKQSSEKINLSCLQFPVPYISIHNIPESMIGLHISSVFQHSSLDFMLSPNPYHFSITSFLWDSPSHKNVPLKKTKSDLSSLPFHPSHPENGIAFYAFHLRSCTTIHTVAQTKNRDAILGLTLPEDLVIPSHSVPFPSDQFLGRHESACPTPGVSGPLL